MLRLDAIPSESRVICQHLILDSIQVTVLTRSHSNKDQFCTYMAIDHARNHDCWYRNTIRDLTKGNSSVTEGRRNSFGTRKCIHCNSDNQVKSCIGDLEKVKCFREILQIER